MLDAAIVEFDAAVRVILHKSGIYKLRGSLTAFKGLPPLTCQSQIADFMKRRLQMVENSGILRFARCCRLLHYLSVDGYDFTDNSLCEVAKQCTLLQTIIITSSPTITDVSVSWLVQRCSALREVALVGCPRVSDFSLVEIAA